jgi:hypothetical protein
MNKAVPPPARRWAVGFADLALLIACSTLLGWRPDAGHVDAAATDPRLATAMRLPVRDLFVEGEAMLSQRGVARLDALMQAQPSGGTLRITVGSAVSGSLRLDRWELAAARTAVIARHIGTRRPLDLAAPRTDSRDVELTFRR